MLIRFSRLIIRSWTSATLRKTLITVSGVVTSISVSTFLASMLIRYYSSSRMMTL